MYVAAYVLRQNSKFKKVKLGEFDTSVDNTLFIFHPDKFLVASGVAVNQDDTCQK